MGRTSVSNLRSAISSVLLCALLVSGCAWPRSTQPVVKIGLIASFEGLGRPLGYEVLHGVKLAVRERNAAGGLAGYRLALVALDDNDDAAHAARQARKMDVDGDVLGVVGPFGRATVRAVAEPLAEAGLAWLIPASAPDEVIAAHSNAFRLFASDADLAEVAIEQAVSAESSAAVGATGRSSLLAVGSTGDFAAPLRTAAERQGYQPIEPMEEAAKRCQRKSGTTGTFIFRLFRFSADEVGEASEAKRVPLALGGNAEQVAGELLSLAGASDISGPEWSAEQRSKRNDPLPFRFSADFIMVAGPEAGRAVVVQRAGEVTEGLIWVSSVLPAAADALPLSFMSGYQALAGGLPGPNAILAYDATNVLLDAIKLDIMQNSRPTRQGVMAALPAIHVEGLSGDIRFDDQGSWLQAPIFAYRVAGDDIFAQPQVLTAGR